MAALTGRRSWNDGDAEGSEDARWRTMGKAGRLTRTADFRRVVHDGQRVSGKRLNVYVLPVDRPPAGLRVRPGQAVRPGQTVRTGVVARREVGGAVARNRARRVLREAWRLVGLKIHRDADVVFVARPGIAGSAMDEVAAEMQALLAQTGMIEP